MKFSLYSLIRLTALIGVIVATYQAGYNYGYSKGRWQQTDWYADALERQWKIYDDRNHDWRSLFQSMNDILDKGGYTDRAEARDSE